jgi:GAF domain-containing protein
MIGYEEEDPAHVWEQDSIIILETIASQVSLALENTRLIAEAQERAQQEKLIANITSRMRETLDVDIILQTAIRELREAFALKQAEIRLQPIENEPNEE